MPKRIQRKRTKGWRLPAGAVCVTRGTRWGNLFKIDATITRTVSIELFRRHVKAMKKEDMEDYLAPLRGKDLACFCPLTESCHADVLLEMANENH